MTVRRIVTGTENNTTVVLAEDKVEPVTAQLLPGVEIYRIWELDNAAIPVTDADEGAHKATFFPGPEGGIRFGRLVIPPGIDYIPAPDADLDAAAVEMESKLPGAAATFAPDRPGEHTTQTVDYIVVLSGHGIMRADGVEFRIAPGDCVIQNGTAHAWFNDGEEPLVMAFTLLGAAIR